MILVSARMQLFSNCLTMCWFLFAWKCCSANDVGMEVQTLQDFPLKMHEDEKKSISFNFYNSSLISEGSVAVRFKTLKPNIATVFGNETFLLTENVTIEVVGHFLGRTNLTISVNALDISSMGDNSNRSVWYDVHKKFRIIVSRKERAIDTAFTVVVIILVVVLNVAMGCKVELAVVKKTLKRPIAPITGFLSQFILMPVISFLLAYFLNFDPGIALGFFATGCSPGGSASNIYTYLLGGDVSLSVTMTLVSTIASLGMIPLWLFTLGTKVLYKGAGLRIPFQNILYSLVGLIIPIGIGLFLKHKKPSWAKNVIKIIRPFTFLFLLFVFTVGVWANLYIFSLLAPMVILAGALLPYCGFIFGGVVAFFARQSKKNIITIAIETGIQNTGIAIVLLRLSLEPPDNDIGIVPPVIGAIFTPVPLVIAIIALEIRKRCCRPKPQYVDDDAEMLSTLPVQDSTPKKLIEETSPEKLMEDTDIPKVDLGTEDIVVTSCGDK